jgi:hypothetical protein
MEEEHLSKISKLETELISLRLKYQQETTAFKKMEENYKFSSDMESKRLQG